MSDAAAKRRNGAPGGAVSLQEAAGRVGVAGTTLRRWAREGLITPYAGTWSPAAVSHAKIMARLRERGHSLGEIRQASEQGRLAFGYVDELFDTREEVYTLEQAAGETGLEPALVERVLAALGRCRSARIGSRPTRCDCSDTSRRYSRLAFRSWRSSSSSASTDRRWRAWPTRR